MKISNEQAALAVDMLRHGGTGFARHDESIDPSVIAQALNAAVNTPDSRADMVEAARSRLNQAPPSSDEVARMMLGRIASDSLR